MEDVRELFIDEGYLLEELLASDSWGELYRATYLSHRRRVLFRRFVPGLAEPAPWELAEAEIQAWARVDHPGVLQPLDWGNPAAGPYLATELPAGLPLASLVKGEGAGDALDVTAVFAGLLDAVESARVLGILHLGLGLTNVWVSPDCSVRVSEFGLWYLRREFPAIDVPAEPCLAPEQRCGGRLSAATDVFALGMIFVALCAGIDASSIAAREGPLPHELPPGMGPVLSNCFAEDPLARPRTAGELRSALGMAPLAQPCTFRDCPVCRLKEEIARDMRSRPVTVLGRMRALAGGAPGRADRGRDSAQAEHPGRPGPAIDPIIPWIAIAALVLATLVVWWMAFR
jgi:serine/threonine protein kinase